MLEKNLLIKEQIDVLFIKYSIFIIIRKMKIPKNLKKFNFNYLINANIYINNKEYKFVAINEKGLYIGLKLLLMELSNNQKKNINTTVYVDNIPFNLKGLNDKNYESSKNFKNFCNIFFKKKKFTFIFNNIDNIFFFSFEIEANKFFIYEDNVDSYFFNNLIYFINFNLLYNCNNLSFVNYEKIIYNNHKNLKKNEISFMYMLNYFYLKYHDIQMFRILLENNKNIKKLKREYFNYGVINYRENSHEYISFCDIGLYCGLEIIKKEISINSGFSEEDYSIYTRIKINKNVYELNITKNGQSIINNDIYNNICEDFINSGTFELIPKKKESPLFCYFFIHNNIFNEKLDLNKLDSDIIFRINSMKISQKQDTEFYKFY